MEEAVIGEARHSGGPAPMSVEGIEREFAHLRMNEDGTVGLRASVLNLMVVTDEASAERVTHTVSELSGRFPCRAIVMISDPDETEPNLEVGVSAYCSVRGGGGGQVCAEQVTVHAEGPPAEHLESLADPLLLPDLPVFLWYPGPFTTGAPEFEGMAALADRVIVDSSAARDHGACLREIAALADRQGAPLVGDLQWVGLTPWRSLICDLFNPADRLPELDRLHRVEVLHDGRGEARALLLVGWLAWALGWTPGGIERDGQVREIHFDTPNGDDVVVEVSGDSEDASLRRVRLYGERLSFQVSRHREREEAASTVMREGELIAQRTTHLGFFEPANILGEELRFRGDDRHYRGALSMAASILEL
jgi:glucose-6-phosphate dehydrogenase assembly protein OpcA